MQSYYIQMPNEIFTDLKQNMDTGSHIAFAYTYYYYSTYLYRYCKYIDDEGDKVTQNVIKEILGYSPANKKVNYIIKKGGILDTIGYTETTNDYPMAYEFEEDTIIQFTTVSELKDQLESMNNRNFRIKKPLKAFYRSVRAMADDELTGTFYGVENTHRMESEQFERVLSMGINPCTAFYILGYIKHKNDIYRTGYQRSSERLGEELGFSDKTIRKYTEKLEKARLISIERKQFHLEKKEDEHEANIYTIIRRNTQKS